MGPGGEKGKSGIGNSVCFQLQSGVAAALLMLAHWRRARRAPSACRTVSRRREPGTRQRAGSTRCAWLGMEAHCEGGAGAAHFEKGREARCKRNANCMPASTKAVSSCWTCSTAEHFPLPFAGELTASPMQLEHLAALQHDGGVVLAQCPLQVGVLPCRRDQGGQGRMQ